MPRWIHIAAVIFFNLATRSNASLTIRSNRHWTPETDRTIFLRPANYDEYPIQYAGIFAQVNNKSALIVHSHETVRAAFVVGSKNQEGNNTLWDPMIEVFLDFKAFPTPLQPVSVTFTLLMRKGEVDININFVETFPGDIGCAETRQPKVDPNTEYPLRIYKNGTITFNDVLVKDTEFKTPIAYGYEYVSLNGTQEQLIPFYVTHTSSEQIYVLTEKRRFALPFPDNWASGGLFTPRPNTFTEAPGEGSEDDGEEGEDEGENDGTTKATAKAGFSDWYYIIIIVAVFLVFMVALGVVLFIKKKLKDKKRRESENRRLAPSVSSQQQQPSVEQEPPAGSAMGTAN